MSTVGHVDQLPRDVAAVVSVPALLSVSTTARLLDYSPRTIRRRIAAGTLPAVVEGGRTMVRADELRDYIDHLERVGRRPGRRRAGAAAGRFAWLRDST
jgi:excisionase family DNA binding protein